MFFLIQRLTTYFINNDTRIILDNKGIVIGHTIRDIINNIDDYILYSNQKILLKDLKKRHLIKQKKLRLKKNFIIFYKISKLCCNYIYFATFTFENVDNFNRELFRKYLIRNCNINFILYHDYGEINGRLHFHGFVSSCHELTNHDCNKFGFVKFVDITFRKNLKKMINYILDYSIKNIDNSSFKVLKSRSFQSIISLNEKNFNLLLDLSDF